MDEIPNIILNTSIVNIIRQEEEDDDIDRKIELMDQDGEVYFFDRLVLGMPLQNIPLVMDVTEEEMDLLSKVTTIPYLTT